MAADFSRITPPMPAIRNLSSDLDNKRVYSKVARFDLSFSSVNCARLFINPLAY